MESNVYTVLSLIAFLILAVACGYVWYRHGQVFGGGNPFSISMADVDTLLRATLHHA